MRKKLLPVVAIVAIMSLAFVTPDTKDKIKEIRTASGTGSRFFTYLPDGRLSAIIINNRDTTSFTYSSKAIYRRVVQRFIRPYTDTFFLDKNGLAVKMVGPGNEGSKPQVYKYDSAGYQKEWTFEQQNRRSIKSCTYSNGNLTVRKAMVIAGKDTGVHVYTFTYYPGTRNTIDNENMGMYYLGRSSANLAKEETLNANDTEDKTTRYYYRFDEQGRVSMRIIKGYNGKSDSTLYTYY